MLFFELFPAFMTVVCGVVALALLVANARAGDLTGRGHRAD